MQDYLTSDTQPLERNEASVHRMKASKHTIVDGELFKKSEMGLLQRCLNDKQDECVLKELHGGEFGNHSGGRNLLHKVL